MKTKTTLVDVGRSSKKAGYGNWEREKKKRVDKRRTNTVITWKWCNLIRGEERRDGEEGWEYRRVRRGKMRREGDEKREKKWGSSWGYGGRKEKVVLWFKYIRTERFSEGWNEEWKGSGRRVRKWRKERDWREEKIRDENNWREKEGRGIVNENKCKEGG